MHFIKAMLIVLLLLMWSEAFAGESAKRCLQLFDNAEYSKAVTVCQTAAEQGDTASQTVLGEMYDAGDGVEADQKIVAKWWTEAANNSYLPVQNLLALKYYYGGNVFELQPDWQQDYLQAFEIWKQSAIKGVATSQYMIGEMYLHGQGVDTDYSESYAWFKIALEGGYKLATDSLIELSRVISAEQKHNGFVRIKQIKNQIAEISAD